jgi:DNA topoisomerase IB
VKPNRTDFLVEAATVPEQHTIALIKLLFAASAATASGETSRELKMIFTQNSASAAKAAKALSSEILPYLAAVISGKEVDEEAYVNELKSLRQAVKETLRPDPDVHQTVLESLGSSLSYLINNGEPALKKIRNLVPVYKDTGLSALFLKNVGSQKDFANPLRKIVRVVGKRDGLTLTAEEGQLLRQKKPEVYREYLKLRQQYGAVWKDELRNFVFKSKRQTVPYREALNHLRAMGIEHTLPKNFEGNIDAGGALYTSANKKISKTPGLGFTITMNPKYDPAADNGYVFTGVSPAGLVHHFYTTNFVQGRGAIKRETVMELQKKIPVIRKRWLTFMQKLDGSRNCVLSTMIETIYAFSARVGGKGNKTDGKETYGISTLQGKQCKIKGSDILITYPGKAGVTQRHLVKSAAGKEAKLLFQNLRPLIEAAGPNDFIFQYSDGETKKVLTAQDANKLFMLLGSPTTLRKIRPLRGTALFVELVQENKDKIFDQNPPLTQLQAEKLLKEFATRVGALLGHVRGVGAQEKVTPATALMSYIDRDVMKSFFGKLGLRNPKFLNKKED